MTVETVFTLKDDVTNPLRQIQARLEAFRTFIQGLREELNKTFSQIHLATIISDTKTAVEGFKGLNDQLAEIAKNKAALSGIAKGLQNAAAAANQARNAAAQIPQPLQQTQNVAGNLAAPVLKFRDSLEKVFNTGINSAARFFRILARLRTAFFILVTFLGIRPIVRFFGSLQEHSLRAQLSVKRLTDTLDEVKRILGDAFAPVIRKLGDQFINLVAGIINFFRKNQALLSVILGLLGRVVSAIKLIGVAVAQVFETWNAGILVVKRSILEVQKFIKDVFDVDLIQTFVDLVDDLRKIPFLEQINKFQLINIFKVADALKSLRDAGGDVEGSLRAIQKEIDASAKKLDSLNAKLVQTFEEVIDGTKSTREFEEALRHALNQADQGLGALIALINRKGVAAFVAMRHGMQQLVEGFASALLEMEKKFTSFEIGKRLAEEIVNGFNDALTEVFVDLTSGLKNIKQILENFLRGIQKAFARTAAETITGAILSAVSGGLANLFNPAPATAPTSGGAPQSAGGISTGPDVSAQHGGITTGTTRVLAHNAEAHVPLRSGRIPVKIDGGAGNNVSVSFSVNAIDAKSSVDFIRSNSRAITAVIADAVGGKSSVLRSKLNLSK